MTDMDGTCSVPYVVIRKEKAGSDTRLREPGNSGCKMLANKIRPEKSMSMQDPEWEPPRSGEKSSILETGWGDEHQGERPYTESEAR